MTLREALLDYERDTYLELEEPRESSSKAEVERSAVARARDGDTIDCAVGYSQWGTSPLAKKALRHLDASLLCRYPEASHDSLLKPDLLAKYEPKGVTANELFLGHGSFNLIERVIHKFLRVDTMVGIGPQFAEIPSEFKAAGGNYHAIPLKLPEYTLPIDDIEATVKAESVSVLYIDNPNNPLGQCFELEDLHRLVDTCEQEGTIVLVDEAWGDFVANECSAIHLVGMHNNVIVVRSFSKALGLAAERVGYMFMSKHLAKYYRKIDVPFEPGIVGAKLAKETLGDTEFISHVRGQVRAAKADVVQALENVGLGVLPTHPDVSILSVHDPSRDIVHEFRSRGILVQAGSSFAHTNPEWNDSFCRLRVVHGSLVPILCDRIGTI